MVQTSTPGPGSPLSTTDKSPRIRSSWTSQAEQDCDWTIFWRQLAALPPALLGGAGLGDDGKLGLLRPAFALGGAEELRPDGWLSWLAAYEEALRSRPAAASPDAVSAVMKAASPKCVQHLGTFSHISRAHSPTSQQRPPARNF